MATAGHVDHGKSSLIVRLTGMDPDRWDEEKRRGLTIDLGYAWCELPSGREVGFVDVPGHERFIANMLAGVGPVRLVLFVVAANEGWRQQSEEHLADPGRPGRRRRRRRADEARSRRRGRPRPRGGRDPRTARRHRPVRCPYRPRLGRRPARVSTTSGRPSTSCLPSAPAPQEARARLFVDRVFTHLRVPAPSSPAPSGVIASPWATRWSSIRTDGRRGSVRSRRTSGARTARTR